MAGVLPLRDPQQGAIRESPQPERAFAVCGSPQRESGSCTSTAHGTFHRRRRVVAEAPLPTDSRLFLIEDSPRNFPTVSKGLSKLPNHGR